MDKNIINSPIKISDGAIEVLKYLALTSMVADHINKYLFNGTIEVLFILGRLAMPVFIFVLAFNLARPGENKAGTYKRIMTRLFTFGVLAFPPYFYMSGNALPLNIMFTLLSLTAIIYFIERKNIIISLVIIFLMGAIVEYWWPALLFGIATWAYIKKPNIGMALLSTLACLSFGFINGNMWAVAAIPLIILMCFFKISIPRYKWFFYAFYPLHLYLLWLIRIPMSHAGYLFF